LFALLPVLLAQFLVPLALALVTITGPSIQVLVIFTGVLPGIIIAHQVWRETLGIKEEDAIGRARDSGDRPWRIIFRHGFPPWASSQIILTPLLMVYAIVLEGALSFLRAGVTPPTPSWGLMVAEGRDRLVDAWRISTFPALAILLTVFSLTLLAEQCRDQFYRRLGRGDMAVRPMGLLAALLAGLRVWGWWSARLSLRATPTPWPGCWEPP
jgi:peptide/nickel transport system permease protein